MSARGIVSTPPDLEPARCYPGEVVAACKRCTRFRHGEAEIAEHRLTLVIDANVVSPVGRPCALRIAAA
jgi:hypothetical protein